MYELSDNINRKFVDTIDLDEWEIETDDGWQSISHIHKTIEYDVWKIIVEDGSELLCADDHIIFTDSYEQIFVKDCIINKTKVITKNGSQKVISLEKLNIPPKNMFDITVETNKHRYWSGNFLSHNTTSAVGAILHYIIFNPYKTVGILANRADTARGILARLKVAFQHLPQWLQVGVTVWNEGSIKLENGCKVIADATTGNTSRGNTFQMLFIDECVIGDTEITIKNKITGKVEKIKIEDFYEILKIENSNNYEILTSDGWKDFTGIKQSLTNKIIKIYFDDDSNIGCTLDHLIFNGNEFIKAQDLQINDKIENLYIINIEYINKEFNVYDILNVSDTNHYITNNITSHNCAHIEGWDEFFTSVYPTISAGKETKVVLVSSPNGLNFFWNLWKGAQEGKNTYNPIFVSWQDVPGRDQKWYETTLAGMNHDLDKFNQEFASEFQGSSGTLIVGWKLKELYGQTPIVTNEIGLKQYEIPIKDHIYWMVVDVSRGKGLDYSALSVIDVTQMPYNQVATFRSNIMTPFDFAEIVHKLAILYNHAFVLVENKDLGAQVCDILYHDFLYEGVLKTERGGKGYGKRISDGLSNEPTERGIATSTQVKSIGCSVCKLLIEQNQLIINDQDTIEEFARFSKKGKSYQAEDGCHDDLAMGIVLFAWATQSQYFKDTTDINTLKQIRDRTEKEHDDIMLPFGFHITDGNETNLDFLPITKTWLQDWLNDVDPRADPEIERKVNNMYGNFKFKDQKRS